MNAIPSFASKLQFLKLGGSLITDKTQVRSPRREMITRLAAEIKTVWDESGGLKLVLGHGSGSFGHVPAKKYGTRQGVKSREDWRGFAEVWGEARALNQLVMEALAAAGLPGMAFPASGSVTARDGQVAVWDLDPLKAALEAGLLPVVYGDVVFDQVRGGTILSTEDLFQHLAWALKPRRITLAGIEAGVWADYPACTQVIEEIQAGIWEAVSGTLKGSAGTDVTGGMATKVEEMLALCTQVEGLEALIFSGEKPGNVVEVLRGGRVGTRILGEFLDADYADGR